MSKYIEVNSKEFKTFLQSKGFSRDAMSGKEIVYSRLHDKEPKLIIKIYTSIASDANAARACGKDAIRVVAIFQGKEKTYPIYKGARIYRVGSQAGVQERVLDRARDAYKRCNEWLKEQR